MTNHTLLLEMAPNQHKHVDPHAGGNAPVECVICAEECRALCVFPCGHFTCYVCGLRVHSIHHGCCPICRQEISNATITRRLCSSEDQYTTEEVHSLRSSTVKDSRLSCEIDDRQLAVEVAKLYEYVCPIEGCWQHGQQDPFLKVSSLNQHLAQEHQLSYCSICLEERPVFLCEQILYGQESLREHFDGCCPNDRSSFTGHPPCKFCKKKNLRFYDGEALLKHMQHMHFTCDVCNRGQFRFTFYDTRDKLNEHFLNTHKVCDHPDCGALDLMLRVFEDEIELGLHKQRVHGVKTRITLTAGISEGTSGTGTVHNAVPTNSSSSNAIHVIFDHVFRQETVELLPLTAKKGNRRRGGNNGATSSGPRAVFLPSGPGLPLHFSQPGSMMQLRHTSSKPAELPMPSPSSPLRPAASSDSLDVLKVPSDSKAIRARLDALLAREITSPVAYADFKRLTKDFLDSKVLASEYYDLIAGTYFTKPEVFAEVMPLLVATVPQENRRTALKELWKMRMSPETQRQAKVRQEEEQRLAEVAEQEEIWDTIKKRNEKQKQKQQPKANVWSTRGKPVRANEWFRDGARHAALTTPAPPPNPEPPAPQTSLRSTAGGWGTTTSAATGGVTRSNNLESRDLYPELPQESVRLQSFPSAKKKPVVKNAWNNRR